MSYKQHNNTMKELAKAIMIAMQKVSHLQSDKKVGAGNNSYKGISDQKATKHIREALLSAGVVALPVDIEVSTSPHQYTEETNYGLKAKVHVFCEVKTTIMLVHAESGESQTVKAIGHGVDNGDKAAGKAMTYAKKNALLNALLISTGDDSDNIHSDDLPAPTVKSNKNTGKHKEVLETLRGDIGTLKQRAFFAKLISSSKFDSIRNKTISAINDGKKQINEAIDYLQSQNQ